MRANLSPSDRLTDKTFRRQMEQREGESKLLRPHNILTCTHAWSKALPEFKSHCLSESRVKHACAHAPLPDLGRLPCFCALGRRSSRSRLRSRQLSRPGRSSDHLFCQFGPFCLFILQTHERGGGVGGDCVHNIESACRRGRRCLAPA